jgi:L-fuconolactonase
MEIIDAQIHSWASGGHAHWAPSYRPPSGVTDWPIESVLVAMEAVGVRAAVLDALPTATTIAADGSERYANDYGEAAAQRYPGTLAATTRYDHRATDIADQVASTRAVPGIVGIRLVIRTDDEAAALEAGEYEAYLDAVERHGIPLFVFASMHLSVVDRIARSHPGLQLIVDHLGMPQPPLRTLDTPPFRRLPLVLDLAKYPNVAVKFCGGPAYSAERYPFGDVWPQLRQIVDAYGAERLMWASDLTRLRGLFTYSELLTFILYSPALTETEKEWILGRTVRRILGWPSVPD